MGDIIFVTGGARSGKSSFAIEQAHAVQAHITQIRRTQQAVTFIATATAFDHEMTDRIQQHQLERPTCWNTLEIPQAVPQALESINGTVVLDCVSIWVSNMLLDGLTEISILTCVHDLIQAQLARDGTLIVVTNEVGSSVVPEYPLGRAFRDILGRANQLIARASTQAFLIVAGLSLQLK